jgi:rhodanese-related sulfurtransferase
VIASNDVVRLFRDPRYDQNLVVFIDARDDAHYAAGHIPGAHQFNHYRPEQYLPNVLPFCLGAMQIVVYCTGGQCEDSEFAALMLRDAGIPAASLFVYPGGMNEWTSLNLPVELGPRRSGQFKPGPAAAKP